MSIFTDAGASHVTGEVAKFVEKKIEENKDKPDALAVLNEIKSQLEGIQKTIDAGYY